MKDYDKIAKKILKEFPAPAKQLQSFQIGAVVLNKLNNQTYVITNTVNGVPIATRTISIYNPAEWEIIAEPKEE